MDFIVKEESLNTFFNVPEEHEPMRRTDSPLSMLSKSEIVVPKKDAQYKVGDNVIFKISDNGRKLNRTYDAEVKFLVEDHDSVSFILKKQ